MIKLNHKEQKEIFESLKKLHKKYRKYHEAILYEPPLSIFYPPHPYLKEHYRFVCAKIRGVVKDIMSRYELPQNSRTIKRIRGDMAIKEKEKINEAIDETRGFDL